MKVTKDSNKKREYNKMYYQKNKEKLNKINKKKSKEWYKDNQKRKIKYQLNYLKNNNYTSEKIDYQRLIRNIKRKTRYYFKLNKHKCEFCGKRATEHHHNTNPIEFDKFNFICHKCHIKIHRIRRR